MHVILDNVAKNYLLIGTKELLHLQRGTGVAAMHSTPLIAPLWPLMGVIFSRFRAPIQNGEYNPVPFDRIAALLVERMEALNEELPKKGEPNHDPATG
jgi:hypothetical protein